MNPNDHEPIRVLVADDHSVVRSGLAAFLSVRDDMELVGEAGDGEEAVRLCGETAPDVVLMDLVMPVMDGPHATAIIRKAYPHVQVIALSGYHDEARVQAALEAGAIGYLLKNVSAPALADAIAAAHHGRPTLAPEATEALVRAATNPHRADQELTPREQEILEMLASGLSNHEIAQKMGLSRSTVKFHVSNILSKLHVSSRTGAVAVSLQNHLAR
ncbi:MAG TPA: response regulator transcription factor [Chloroflexia bacterium]|nr:response regulator transcription factor [Chloroflexia bacterium]